MATPLLQFAAASFLLASVYLTVPAAAQQPDPLLPPAEGFDFRGRVLLAETNQPLPGATVRLERYEDKKNRYAETTGDDGQFAFLGVPQGGYSLRVELDGYVRAGFPLQEGIELSDDARVPYMTLKMAKTSGVAGFVEDKDGNPLAGVQVGLLEQLWVSESPVLRPYKHATTDDNGAFSIVAAPGEYFLYALLEAPPEAALGKTPPSGMPQFIGTFYPNSADLDSAAPVTLYPGGPLSGVTIELQQAALYTVAGRLEGVESFAPGLAKVTVKLKRSWRSESGLPIFGSDMPGEAPPPRVETDGSFRIEGVAPGSYLASARLGAATIGNARVTVVDRDVKDLRVIAPPVAAFSGRIVLEDPQYRGRILVWLQGLDPEVIRAFSAEVYESGEFEIPRATPGTYAIKLYADPPLFVTRVEFPGESSPGATFELAAGGSDRVVVRASPQGATIAGRVSGNFRPESPASGLVSLVRMPSTYLELNDMAAVPVETNGSFAAQALQPGRYRICAWREEDNAFIRVLSNPQLQRRLDHTCETVEVKAGQRQYVSLDPLNVGDFKP